MELFPQVLHGDGALVGFSEIPVGGAEAPANFHGDMRDQHAMLLPELLDLLLAHVQEAVEIMDEEHPLARGVRRATPAKENVVGIL